jgi:crotonobetainyl-CoA:carnitine CoA-transferase CaiB-like acyl-CoA transferase
VAEVLDSPQVQALGLVRTVDHPTAGRLRLIGSPLHLNGAPPPIRLPPPQLGQHSTAQLADTLAHPPAEIAARARVGVFRVGDGG